VNHPVSKPKDDPRLTPVLHDGMTGRPFRVVHGVAPLRPRPGTDAGIDSELIFGETVQLFDEGEGWSYVQAERDGYVGYLISNTVAPAGARATHTVKVLRTYVYAGPSIKVPDPILAPQGALLTVVGIEKDFVKLDTGGYVFMAHVQPITEVQPDYVSVAEAYMGTPYLWGGRTSIGLDCSGLIQTSLRAAGIAAPRDSDMLEGFCLTSVPITDDLAGLKRGDILFWKGHCGLMQDAQTLLHANGHHMSVASEPLRQAVDRILAKSFGALTSIKRL
jgi:NlpC/P60 family/Bacterial dipeptidyl-peptidase Sh3 domain